MPRPAPRPPLPRLGLQPPLGLREPGSHTSHLLPSGLRDDLWSLQLPSEGGLGNLGGPPLILGSVGLFVVLACFPLVPGDRPAGGKQVQGRESGTEHPPGLRLRAGQGRGQPPGNLRKFWVRGPATQSNPIPAATRRCHCYRQVQFLGGTIVWLLLKSPSLILPHH